MTTTTLTVTWDAVTLREDNSIVTVDHYKIYRSGNASAPQYFGETTPANVRSFTLAGAIVGNTYTFQIAAVSVNGIEGTKSAAVAFFIPTPETDSPPRAPANVVVTNA